MYILVVNAYPCWCNRTVFIYGISLHHCAVILKSRAIFFSSIFSLGQSSSIISVSCIVTIKKANACQCRWQCEVMFALDLEKSANWKNAQLLWDESPIGTAPCPLDCLLFFLIHTWLRLSIVVWALDATACVIKKTKQKNNYNKLPPNNCWGIVIPSLCEVTNDPAWKKLRCTLVSVQHQVFISRCECNVICFKWSCQSYSRYQLCSMESLVWRWPVA